MVRLGQRLHKERVRQKLSLEEIASAIKIKTVFLSAIERGEFSKLPSSSYAQGFVHNYSAYLGIPKAEITALFKREFDEKRAFKVLPDSLVQQKEFPVKRLKMQQSLLLAAGVFLVFLIYLLFEYRAAFFPPALSINSPEENATTNSEIIVTGNADASATVFVNGSPVPLDASGNFTRRLVLFSGKEKISVKAVNRFGKQNIQVRDISVK